MPVGEMGPETLRPPASSARFDQRVDLFVRLASGLRDLVERAVVRPQIGEIGAS
jgi:hypothetical protein